MDRIEIGRIGKWSIKVVPWPGYNEDGAWWNGHVSHPTKEGRYSVNWNGERFARSTDLQRLALKNPTLFFKIERKFRDWYEKQSNSTQN